MHVPKSNLDEWYEKDQLKQRGDVMTVRKHKCSLNANLRQIIGPVFKTLFFKNCAEQVQANTKFRET